MANAKRQNGWRQIQHAAELARQADNLKKTWSRSSKHRSMPPEGRPSIRVPARKKVFGRVTGTRRVEGCR
jgi:hypothetical protein